MTSAASQWAAAQKKSRDPKMGGNLQRRIDEAMAKKAPRKKEAPAKPKKKGAHKKDTTPLEHYSQAKIATFLDWAGLLWCHVGNERVKKSEAGKLASQGIKKGVPDILIFTPPPGGEFVGTAMEIKRLSRRAKSNPVAGASVDQLQWGEDLQKSGWLWRMGYGHVDPIKDLCEIYQIKLSRYDMARFLEE